MRTNSGFKIKIHQFILSTNFEKHTFPEKTFTPGQRSNGDKEYEHCSLRP